MGFRESLAAWIAPKQSSTESIGGAKAITDIYEWTDPTVGYLNANSAMGLQNAHQAMISMAVQWVGICSKFKAIQCADTPLRLYRKAGARGIGGKSVRVKSRKRNEYLRDRSTRGPGRKSAMYAEQAGDIEEILDSPILDLLHAPNPWDGPLAYARRLYQSLSLTGNGYELMCDDGEMMLLPMLPQWVRVKPNREMLIDGYLYGRYQGMYETYSVDDVVHHKQFPSIDNPFYGVGDLSDVMAESQVFAFAIQYELYNMQNGIRPGDIAIKAKQGTTKDQVELMRSELRRKYQGPRQSGTPMIFVEAEPVPLMRTNKDMEYQEGMRRIVQQTMAAFGIPEDLLMRREGSISIGGGGQKSDALSVFQATTVQPTIRSVCETWNSTLLPRLGYEPGDVWLAYDNPCGESTAEEVDRATKLVPIGVMTINEARSEAGLDDVEGGDVPRINGTPLDKVGQQQFGSGLFDYRQDRPAFSDMRDKPADTTTDDGPDAKRVKVVRASAAMWAHGKAVGDDEPESAKLYRNLLAYFRKVEPRLMNSLDPSFGLRIRMDADQQMVQDWYRATEPLATLFEGGWKVGVTQLPATAATKPMNAIGEAAIGYLREYQGQILRSVSDTTDMRVREAISSSIESGETLNLRVQRVKEILGDGLGNVARNVTRTESAAAYTKGAIQAWKESGVVGRVKWLLSGDPCPFCEAMSGMEVPLGEDFFPLGGSLTVGGKTMHFDYRAIDGPPLHPMCRCGVNSIELETDE